MPVQHIHIRLQRRLLPVRVVLPTAALRRLSSSSRGAGAGAVELAEELLDGGHARGVELVDGAGVDGDADAPGFGVHAEGRFEQVVAVFRDFGVETGVRVLQDDVFSGSLQFLWGVIVTPLETE